MKIASSSYQNGTLGRLKQKKYYKYLVRRRVRPVSLWFGWQVALLLSSDSPLFVEETLTGLETPIVAVTRCGIGIFDEKWWAARLHLLKAITVPSLSRFKGKNFIWFIVLDSSVPTRIYEELHSIIDGGAEGFVRFVFVESNAQTRDAIMNSVKSVVPPSKRVAVLRIDDDDAVADDFFDNVFKEIEIAPDKPAVVSMSKGLALNAPTQEVGNLTYVSHPCNTVFYGKLSELDKVMFQNHVKWLSVAKRLGYRSVASVAKHPQFLYTYHKQADGSYENRVAGIDTWREISDVDVKRFGINIQALKHWAELQAEIPPTIGLTWRRTQGELLKMEQLKKAMKELKREIVKTNSSIFDPSVPFLYVYQPMHNTKVKAGRIKFTGLTNSGAAVSLHVTGKSGKYREMVSVELGQDSGEFALVGKFNPGTWNIRIISEFNSAKGPQRKQLDYVIHAR